MPPLRVLAACVLLAACCASGERTGHHPHRKRAHHHKRGAGRAPPQPVKLHAAPVAAFDVKLLSVHGIPNVGLVTLAQAHPYWPKTVLYDVALAGGGGVTVAGNFTVGDGEAVYAVTLPQLRAPGRQVYTLRLYRDAVSLPLAELRAENLGIPQWVALVPALLTPALCAAFRHPAPGALVALWVCASIAYANPAAGFIHAWDRYIVSAVANGCLARALLAVGTLSCVVALLQKAGGALALAVALKPWMRTRRRGEAALLLLTALLSIDERVAVSLAGHALAPLHPLGRDGRARVAALLHAVGTCVTSFLPTSVWGVLQLALLIVPFQEAGVGIGPLQALLWTLPYRVFPLLLLGGCAVWVWHGPRPAVAAPAPASPHPPRPSGAAQSQRYCDLRGSYAVLTYESLCLDPGANAPLRIRNFALPMLFLAVAFPCAAAATSALDYSAGFSNGPFPGAFSDAWWRTPLAGASPHALDVCIWVSFTAACFTAALAVGQGLLPASEVFPTCVKGVQNAVAPLLVMTVAYCFTFVYSDFHTAAVLAGAVHGAAPAALVPGAFAAACVLSAACGSGLLALGLTVPLAVACAATGDFTEDALNLRVVHALGAVCGGCVYGELTSPFSEGAVLTAVSAGCGAREQGKVQRRFATAVAAAALLVTAVTEALPDVPLYVAVPAALASASFATRLLHRAAARRAGKPVYALLPAAPCDLESSPTASSSWRSDGTSV
eukprot:TRINITY_DN1919_c0_g6_i1.p1 TRINITY_DN1919_c0_g6~~TRINITY_DN1919_c0_g6_i1.p1  ORF type:complete len:724 (+),score=218.64 TRINITY_DN1919_c0_g6_i1:83-2254(+)